MRHVLITVLMASTVLAVAGCQSTGTGTDTVAAFKATRGVITGYGSGYQIRRPDGTYCFVTATHVVDGMRPNLPVAYNAVTYNGDRVAYLLVAPYPGLETLAEGPAPKVGDRLRAFGYAMPGGKLTVIEGICTAPGHMTTCVQNGMSGGPVLDSRGRVVGTISSFLPEIGVTIYE